MSSQRRQTRRVQVGTMPVGGGAPVTIQSMTTVDTKDTRAVLDQIALLAARGCDIVRVALYDRDCTKVVREICEVSPIPVVGDVHFDAEIAVRAIENGIHKIRINPGNIGNVSAVQRVVDAARDHGVPIRVGANGGSLPQELKARYLSEPAQALVEAALQEVRQLEEMRFENIVVSMKSSNPAVHVAACRAAAKRIPYPLHLGVTEAGTHDHAVVKSAVGLAPLLLDGIGDTIRVSISGDPAQEIGAAQEILAACGIRRRNVEIISCPTCARCGIDVESAARRIEKIAAQCRYPVTIAVMGCEVNGPGEASRADIGIAGSPRGPVIFECGHVTRRERDLEEAVRALEEALRAQQQRAAADAPEKPAEH